MIRNLAGYRPYVGLMLTSAANGFLRNAIPSSSADFSSQIAGANGVGLPSSARILAVNAHRPPVDAVNQRAGALGHTPVQALLQPSASLSAARQGRVNSAAVNSPMRDPAAMTVALTRLDPLPAPDGIFSPENHVQTLNDRLTELEPIMYEEVQAALPKGLRQQDVSAEVLTSGLEKLCQQIKATPIHIGFVCDKKFFDAKGEFWSSGKYFNRPLWYQQKGYQVPSPRPFEPKGAAPEDQPLYGALNLGMQGHGGWGASYFVLKPSACKTVELRSRDTGEPDGIGAFATMATRDKPLPIVADWIRMGMLPKIWPAMTSEKRAEFYVSPSANTEAAIYMNKGYVDSDDVALIIISKTEAEKNGVDLTQLTQAGEVHGIPVICHDYGDSKIPFNALPEYQAVLADYADDVNKAAS